MNTLFFLFLACGDKDEDTSVEEAEETTEETEEETEEKTGGEVRQSGEKVLTLSRLRAACRASLRAG